MNLLYTLQIILATAKARLSLLITYATLADNQTGLRDLSQSHTRTHHRTGPNKRKAPTLAGRRFVRPWLRPRNVDKS